MKDYARYWFIARRKLGVDDTISIGLIRPESSNVAVDWHFVPHADVDGFGAIKQLLRKLKVQRFHQPEGRETRIPGWLDLIRQGAHKSESGPAPDWRTSYPLKRKYPLKNTYPSQKVQDDLPIAWRCLSEEDTKILVRRARRAGLAWFVLAFQTLHETVMENLTDGHGGSWFMPVNLRGAVQLDDDDKNHSSGFYFFTPGNIAPKDMQRCIKQSLKRGKHWWMFRQAALVYRFGQTGVDLIYRFFIRDRQHLGTLAMLGEWSIDFQGSSVPDDSLLFGVAPGSPNHPVTIGVMICNGRMTLALKLHPVLGITAQRREEIMAIWLEKLRHWGVDETALNSRESRKV